MLLSIFDFVDYEMEIDCVLIPLRALFDSSGKSKFRRLSTFARPGPGARAKYSHNVINCKCCLLEVGVGCRKV